MKVMFVSPTGSDLTGNGSCEHPYRTIEYALSLFTDGDQIRLLEGTYTPTDSIVISGKAGSLFADYPGSAIIEPISCTLSNACISILDSPRFTLAGIKIRQSQDKAANAGIYGYNVENFLCFTCEVNGFDIVSGNAYGILARGSGRIENCKIYDIDSFGDELYGISTDGLHIVDCEVYALSGTGAVRGINMASQTLAQIVDFQVIIL